MQFDVVLTVLLFGVMSSWAPHLYASAFYDEFFSACQGKRELTNYGPECDLEVRLAICTACRSWVLPGYCRGTVGPCALLADRARCDVGHRRYFRVAGARLG